MAYGVRWQIPFVARDGNKFRIDILLYGYNLSTVSTLRGGVSPIETSEESSENIFAPIRKQTGKLTIADTGYDEEGAEFKYVELLPLNILGEHSTQVQLLQIASDNSATLRWIGYIRPDTLTSRLFDKVNIREFQLVCPLGAMYEAPVSFSNTAIDLGTVKTMGQILHTALNATNVAWHNVYMQYNVEDKKDLTAKVSLLNFLGDKKPAQVNASDVETITATWTEDGTSWASIVEEICKFWGWTIYTRGLDIYIVARHQYRQFVYFPFAELAATTEGGYGSDSFIQMYIDIENLQFASTNHTESLQLGYRNISVQSSVNEQDTVLDPDYSKLDMSYWMAAGNTNQPIHISNNYMYIARRMTPAPVPGEQSNNVYNQFIDNFQIWENRQLQILSLDAPFITYFSDGWQGEEYPTKSAFNMKKGICSYQGGQTRIKTFFAKTLEDICIPQGSTMCIEARAELNYNPDPDYPSCGSSEKSGGPFTNPNTTPPYADDPVLYHGTDGDVWMLKPVFEKTVTQGYTETLVQREIPVSLKCGDKYWDDDGQVWTTTETIFLLKTSADGTVTSPRNTYTNNSVSGILFNMPHGANGFCMQNTNSNINGRLKISVYNIPGSPNTRLMNCVLTDLRISIYNPDNKMYPKAKGTHERKNVASTNFNRNLSVNLSMASATESTYGLGLVYNNQIVPLTTVPVFTDQNNTINKIPEQNLLETMLNAYSYVTTSDTIEIFDNPTAECPICYVSGHWREEGVPFYPLYVSHKWREGTMKLTIIDK